jgi:hypothetical protein
MIAGMTAMLLLAGCARPVGDFGRAEPDVINDKILPAAGTLRAMVAGEPVSGFNKTDEEVEMADRVWRFMTSGRTKDWFYDIAAEWRRTRIWPGISFGPDRYYNWLHGTAYQSAGVRYATLGADVGADLATIPDTFIAICKVHTIDRQRQVAADHLPVLQDSQQTDMVARKAENAMQIDGFVQALRYRDASYNYALDHLLVETPHAEARQVDADLEALGAAVGRAERGDFCGTRDVFGDHRHGGRVIPPRIEGGRATPADVAVHAS